MKKILVISLLMWLMNGCASKTSPSCEENILKAKEAEDIALRAAKKDYAQGDLHGQQNMLEAAKNMHEAVNILKDGCKD